MLPRIAHVGHLLRTPGGPGVCWEAVQADWSVSPAAAYRCFGLLRECIVTAEVRRTRAEAGFLTHHHFGWTQAPVHLAACWCRGSTLGASERGQPRVRAAAAAARGSGLVRPSCLGRRRTTCCLTTSQLSFVGPCTAGLCAGASQLWRLQQGTRQHCQTQSRGILSPGSRRAARAGDRPRTPQEQ